jgi:hypothetical protein
MHIMKALKLTSAMFCFLLSTTAYSQTKPDSLGLPGDNFDLYGALELFKKADTPENFEKALNSNDNEVNNLDLDGDGKVDYVKVIDKQDGSAHTLVLQVAVSESETQDVAVIEVDKTNDGTAHVQIVGDEELYGKDYIIEPKDDTANKQQSTTAGKQAATDDVYSTSDDASRKSSSTNDNNNTNTYNSSSANYNPNPTVVVNVWSWPSVQYIYGPSYAPWISPWYWNTYPVWWTPWQPLYWRYHHRRAWHYHYPYYHRVGYYRSPKVHNWYYGRRTNSQTVRSHRESGFYGQKQMTYKNNTPRGQKYNNQPARMDGIQKQNIQQQPQKTGGMKQQGNFQDQQGVKQKPMQNQPLRQQPNKGQMQQQPVKQQIPKQQNIPRRQSTPKQQHTAPAQKMQHGNRPR